MLIKFQFNFIVRRSVIAGFTGSSNEHYTISASAEHIKRKIRLSQDLTQRSDVFYVCIGPSTQKRSLARALSYSSYTSISINKKRRITLYAYKATFFQSTPHSFVPVAVFFNNNVFEWYFQFLTRRKSNLLLIVRSYLLPNPKYNLFLLYYGDYYYNYNLFRDIAEGTSKLYEFIIIVLIDLETMCDAAEINNIDINHSRLYFILTTGHD